MKVKTDKLQDLIFERNGTEIKLRALNDQIEALERKKKLPALRKQYEGKYFTYENGFNSDDRWKIYIYCRQVTDVNKCIIDCFESKTNGEHEFKTREDAYIRLLGEPSNKHEWNKALRKFKKFVNGL